LSAERSSPNRDREAELLALAGELRPELHRYCARLMGSVIDGEDVVQDTIIRAVVALQDLEAKGLDHGPLSVIAKLSRQGFAPPSRATVARTFNRAGVVVPEPRKKPRSASSAS